jgi:hypothetical protein
MDVCRRETPLLKPIAAQPGDMGTQRLVACHLFDGG